MYSGSSGVGVGADAAVLVFRHLILVNHPFERAAIAQSVFKGFTLVSQGSDVFVILANGAMRGSNKIVTTHNGGAILHFSFQIQILVFSSGGHGTP